MDGWIWIWIYILFFFGSKSIVALVLTTRYINNKIKQNQYIHPDTFSFPLFPSKLWQNNNNNTVNSGREAFTGFLLCHGFTYIQCVCFSFILGCLSLKARAYIAYMLVGTCTLHWIFLLFTSFHPNLISKVREGEGFSLL